MAWCCTASTLGMPTWIYYEIWHESYVCHSAQCQRALLLTASCCALKGLRGALYGDSHLSFYSHFCCPSRRRVEWNHRQLIIWVSLLSKDIKVEEFYEQSRPENILLKPIFRHKNKTTKPCKGNLLHYKNPILNPTSVQWCEELMWREGQVW